MLYCELTHKKTWVIWEGKFNLRKSLNSFAMRALAWTPIYSIVFIGAVSRVFPIFINGQQFTTSITNGNGNNRNNSCILRSNKDCNFCIQSAKCGWCADPNWTGPRCDTRNWYVILLFSFEKQHIWFQFWIICIVSIFDLLQKIWTSMVCIFLLKSNTSKFFWQGVVFLSDQHILSPINPKYKD